MSFVDDDNAPLDPVECETIVITGRLKSLGEMVLTADVRGEILRLADRLRSILTGDDAAALV